jgi:uroporphyrinogen-III synthase
VGARDGKTTIARVLLTRPRENVADLADRLEQLGHAIVVQPLIATEPVGPAVVEMDGYDWVVVTSRVGARELARRARGAPKQLAAIGPGTAAELRRSGLEPDLVSRVSTQEGLLADLPRPPGRVLFAGAEGARRLLVDELGADFVPLYRTHALRPLELPAADLVVLASPSAARAFGALHVDLPAVSIGPETSAAARDAAVHVVAEARTHDVEGVIDAVILACR